VPAGTLPMTANRTSGAALMGALMEALMEALRNNANSADSIRLDASRRRGGVSKSDIGRRVEQCAQLIK